MGNKLAMAIFGLVALGASQSWAGSLGNGSHQPLIARYAFCYAGNPNVVYLSQILKLAPAETPGHVARVYSDYVMRTYGLPAIDRWRCIASPASADVVAEKRRDLGLFGTTRIVEIEWSGDGANLQ